MSVPIPIEDIRQALCAFLAKALDMPVDRIDANEKFIDMGADSIVMAEAGHWLETHYGMTFEMERLFSDLSSVNALAEHIHRHGSQGPAPLASHAMPLPTGESDSEGVVALMREQLQLIERVISLQNQVLMRLPFEMPNQPTQHPAAST